jgi:hypothetical protein
MEISDLKNAWEQQKGYFEGQLICEDDISFVIHQDSDRQAKVRRVLYNLSSFVILLTFCQTC